MARTDDPVRQQQVKDPNAGLGGAFRSRVALEAFFGEAPAGWVVGVSDPREIPKSEGIPSDGLAVASLLRP